MANCVIFGAGVFTGLAVPVSPEDYVIAADGGYAHTKKLQIPPHVILGDFDSLGYVPENAAVYPVEKDDTDTMLAIRTGLDTGFRTFILYGVLDGPRLDHTLASLQALQFLADRGAAGYLVGQHQIVTLIQNSCLSLPERFTGTVSVLCMGEPARGVDISGLQYPLTNGTLDAGFPLGVSNAFVGKPATIRVEQGSLLVIYDRKNGLT